MKRDFGAAAFFVALAVAMTWPLARIITRGVAYPEESLLRAMPVYYRCSATTTWAAHGDHQGADNAQSGGDQAGRGEGGELCAPFRGQGSRGTPTRDRAIPVATDSLKAGRSLRHAVPPWIYSHARPNC